MRFCSKHSKVVSLINVKQLVYHNGTATTMFVRVCPVCTKVYNRNVLIEKFNSSLQVLQKYDLIH